MNNCSLLAVIEALCLIVWYYGALKSVGKVFNANVLRPDGCNVALKVAVQMSALEKAQLKLLYGSFVTSYRLLI